MGAVSKIAEAFVAVADLAMRLGLSRLNELPGCWERQIDADWWIALNAHDVPTKCSAGPDVPPFSVYIRWRDWPTGVIDPGGGVLMMGPGEDAFIAAVERATAP